ncbi:MAG TPA: thiamine-binding protein [Segeticoccus sp.]|uniref:thiamine-binding protein n=1 Tax=Segeticoccus sp. TaxID=2706531 RepID=UPI002D7F0A5A|nr:thiamine-binding protein [Segeticoccus sp.]HET8599963.1 thiamine-binding protein [Segeticoccus sp.]
MLFAFSISPSTVGDNGSVSESLAGAIKVIRESGLPNETTSMFTTIEGEWDECLDVIKRACEAAGSDGGRVGLVLKADIRPGYTGQLTEKVQRLDSAVERHSSAS